jgi:hypothetical protein
MHLSHITQGNTFCQLALEFVSFSDSDFRFKLATNMEQFEFHAAEAYPGRAWQEVEPGIHEMTLNVDPSSGRRTVLQRWQPGAVNSKDVC